MPKILFALLVALVSIIGWQALQAYKQKDFTDLSLLRPDFMNVEKVAAPDPLDVARAEQLANEKYYEYIRIINTPGYLPAEVIQQQMALAQQQGPAVLMVPAMSHDADGYHAPSATAMVYPEKQTITTPPQTQVVVPQQTVTIPVPTAPAAPATNVVTQSTQPITTNPAASPVTPTTHPSTTTNNNNIVEKPLGLPSLNPVLPTNPAATGNNTATNPLTIPNSTNVTPTLPASNNAMTQQPLALPGTTNNNSLPVTQPTQPSTTTPGLTTPSLPVASTTPTTTEPRLAPLVPTPGTEIAGKAPPQQPFTTPSTPPLLAGQNPGNNSPTDPLSLPSLAGTGSSPDAPRPPPLLPATTSGWGQTGTPTQPISLPGTGNPQPQPTGQLPGSSTGFPTPANPQFQPPQQPVGLNVPAANQNQRVGKIRIASFNIQVFGEKKISDQNVMPIITDIIRKYDVVAIQEIRSVRDDIIPQLIQMLNANGRRYDFVIGPRLGRSNSKEQYVYVFDTDTVECDRSTVYTVPDPKGILHRPPLVASFRARSAVPQTAFTWTLINIHTDPDEIATELPALIDVVNNVRRDGRGEDDVILLGDLNANEKQLSALVQSAQLMMVIQGQPSNTRGDKLYDNILFNPTATAEFTQASGVLDYARDYGLTEAQALQVSDHRPIWAEFSTVEGVSNPLQMVNQGGVVGR